MLAVFEKLIVLSLFCIVVCVKGFDKPTFRLVSDCDTEGTLLTSKDLDEKTIDSSKQTIFIINGVDQPEGKTDAWYKDLMEEYLVKKNVFLVDWEFDSKSYTWNQIESVGCALSEFIIALFNMYSNTYLEVHLVGVFAGSWVASIAGNRVFEITNKKMWAVTALDPTYYLIKDKYTKIFTPNDGYQKEAIYSNPCKLHKRIEENYSTIYYVDDKKCKGEFGKLMTVKLYAMSINLKKLLKAVKCKTLKAFRGGKCDHNERGAFGEVYGAPNYGTLFLNPCQ